MAKSLEVDEVIEAFKELGGEAQWRSIKKIITNKRENSYAPYKDWTNFYTTMFQLLQAHCADYAKFRGTALFEHSTRGFRLITTERTRIPPEHVHPETVPSNRKYTTGAVRNVLINRYERDPKARKECIEAHGTSCAVCGIDFESIYGDIGRGFIHVHHKKPLSSREVYTLNPVTDLVPVCPNCHSMLHTSDPPLDIDELKEAMNIARTQNSNG